jgi:spore coat polysaccharide biosynthesis protein SpsF
MILAILQARMTSTRLPGKVMRPLLGKPMLARQIERIARAKRIGHLVVATSDDPSDDPIAALCDELGVSCYRGALEDVLDRFYKAAKCHVARHVVRLTGDCPLIDPNLIDSVIDYYLAGNYDYVSNTVEPTFPDGLDVEIFRFPCLERAWREARLPSQREHVTLFIYSHPEQFRIGSYKSKEDLSALRWTVDEPIDLDLAEKIYEALYPANPAFTTDDVLALLKQQPDLKTLNASHRRNEGLQRSMAGDATGQNVSAGEQ